MTTPSATTPPSLPPHQDQWIPLPAGRVFVRSWLPEPGQPASGPLDPAIPLLLFHDSLGCVEVWRDFPAHLCAATGRRVIAYDRLGFGRSDPRDDVLDLGFVAAEARDTLPRLRTALNIGPFIALGHSVGGGMAVECAARYPGDCQALITIAAQVFAEERTLEGIRSAKAQFADPAQVERLARYHGEKARWVLDAWTESWLHPDFQAWTLAEVLPRVACPVLAIHGEHDEYGTAIHPQTIGRLAGGPAQVALLPDTYHLPHREDPAGIAQRVARFLGGEVVQPAQSA